MTKVMHGCGEHRMLSSFEVLIKYDCESHQDEEVCGRKKASSFLATSSKGLGEVSTSRKNNSNYLLPLTGAARQPSSTGDHVKAVAC